MPRAFLLQDGHGFTFIAPADTTLRTLIVHVGGFHSGGTLTAHLSDGSAVDYTDSSSTLNVQYDRNYTLTYRAGGPGQTLRVTWAMATGDGNVTISAAALSVAPVGSITATAERRRARPSTRRLHGAAGDGAGFGKQSGVGRDGDVHGAGQAGRARFGVSATATATTNGSGVATAPPLTANATAGSYTVTASAPGVAAAGQLQSDQYRRCSRECERDGGDAAEHARSTRRLERRSRRRWLMRWAIRCRA